MEGEGRTELRASLISKGVLCTEMQNFHVGVSADDSLERSTQCSHSQVPSPPHGCSLFYQAAMDAVIK